MITEIPSKYKASIILSDSTLLYKFHASLTFTKEFKACKFIKGETIFLRYF